ncbi:DUF6454 family protein [Paenibacillus sp. R14(2021)]|uniref:DUF6454 family protein n=1 Tax=Paenibacillus sp. R14(2021) TaxID=2859228 RepID=UPI001C615E33|nr:DUF6454 family protein [Paenibacillus sp. R14(2021)]
MDNEKLIAQFLKLTRSTKWEQNAKIDLQFNNYHSQGMVRIGEYFYMSSVELLEAPVRFDEEMGGLDRSPGRGIGHLFVFDEQGRLVNAVTLGEGSIYHPGGIDYDGTHIWLPVAEYRPHASSILYRVDPNTLAVEEVFRFHDHIGGLVRDAGRDRLIGNSWGSRTFYEWNANGELTRSKRNSSHYVDYQDGQYVGNGKMIVSGISELPVPQNIMPGPYELGGVALIDIDTFEIIHEAPITQFSCQGHVITRNPVYIESRGEELRLYAVPDDDTGSLLIYDTYDLNAAR